MTSPEGPPTLRPMDPGRRETNTTEVARRLLEYVLAGHFALGHRLPSERSLAQTLGVGRSVVREALKSLTLLGIVEVRQGDGTFLRSTESDLLPNAIEWGLMLGTRRTRDLIEVRRHLEPILASLAAQRRHESDLADLKVQMDRMSDAGSDRDAFIAADIAFHLQIAEATDNESFLQIMISVRSLLQVWIARVVHATEDSARLAAEHAPIYDAIAARDSEGAARAMDDHLGQALARLEDTITAVPEKEGSSADSPDSADRSTTRG